MIFLLLSNTAFSIELSHICNISFLNFYLIMYPLNVHCILTADKWILRSMSSLNFYFSLYLLQQVCILTTDFKIISPCLASLYLIHLLFSYSYSRQKSSYEFLYLNSCLDLQFMNYLSFSFLIYCQRYLPIESNRSSIDQFHSNSLLLILTPNHDLYTSHNNFLRSN